MSKEKTAESKHKVLVSFFWNEGRMGDVEGLFVTTKEKIEKSLGKEVYFGEILGKHSEIFGTLKKEDFTVKSDDPAFIDKLVEIIGAETISGYNPFDYLEEEPELDEGFITVTGTLPLISYYVLDIEFVEL